MSAIGNHVHASLPRATIMPTGTFVFLNICPKPMVDVGQSTATILPKSVLIRRLWIEDPTRNLR